jgi:hypothetical protein
MPDFFNLKLWRITNKLRRLTTQKTYKRLIKRNIFFRRYSLWLNIDHLLYISGGIFSEEYKRFYLRDIRAIFIYRTLTGKIWNIVLGSFGSLAILLITAAGEGWAIILGAISSIFILGLLFVNLFLGPTCKCNIQTAVQTQNLASLNRLSKALKLTDRIKPLISRAQGTEL